MDQPLALTDPDVWSSVVTAAHPASLLVAIGSRMGAEMRQRFTPEDIWQETLLKAWQARDTFVWHGTPAFRRWLLRIAERCVSDHSDRERAQKRGLARVVAQPAREHELTGARNSPEPWGSTTPSRIAHQREQAQAMIAALAALPEDLREVVRLRLFEDLLIGEIAERLGLGESGVRHRFRRGAELYREELRRRLDASRMPVGHADGPAPGFRS